MKKHSREVSYCGPSLYTLYGPASIRYFWIAVLIELEQLLCQEKHNTGAAIATPVDETTVLFPKNGPHALTVDSQQSGIPSPSGSHGAGPSEKM